MVMAASFSSKEDEIKVLQAQLQERDKTIIQQTVMLQSLQVTVSDLKQTIEWLREDLKELKGEAKGKKDFKEKGKDKGNKHVLKDSFQAPAPFVPKTMLAEPEWQQVKRKEKKKLTKEETQVQLRREDWPVPIIEHEAFGDGREGIAIVSQTMGETLLSQMKYCRGQMAVLTNKFIAGADSRQLEVQVRKPDGTTNVHVKYLTNLGDREVAPLQERKSEMEACTFQVENKTRRVVIQLHERYADKGLYSAARKQPRSAFVNWFKDEGVQDCLMHLSNPFVKQALDSETEWLEAVAYVRETSLGKCLGLSGRKGYFVNQFFDKDNVDDGSLRKVWFDPGTSLKDALERAARYSNFVCGLVCNRRGLGVRVPGSSFNDMVSKLLGAEAAADVLRRQGQKIYEISRAPPWLDFEDLQEQFRYQWNWETELVRYLRRGNTKVILVRAKGEPLKDSIIVQQHILPIQQAPLRPQSAITSFQMKTPVAASIPAVRQQQKPKVAISQNERRTSHSEEGAKTGALGSENGPRTEARDIMDFMRKEFSFFRHTLHEHEMKMEALGHEIFNLSEKVKEIDDEDEECDDPNLSDVDVDVDDELDLGIDDDVPLVRKSRKPMKRKLKKAKVTES